jgi:predicted amidohydrolase YtcJ
VPLPTRQTWERAILNAQDHLLSLGITGWQDAWVTPATADAYRALEEGERLKALVVGAQWWEWDQGLDQIARFENERRISSGRAFRAGTVKIMIDGILENYTGALLEPYCSGCGGANPDRGMMHVDEDMLNAAVMALDRKGFQVHMHATGDRAVRAGLDAVQLAQEQNQTGHNRHHIAHVQLVHPSDIQRFRELSVVANCQAFWAKADRQINELTAPQIGEHRAQAMFPFADLARSGATLAMGSDWAVTTANPLEQIEVAVTRTDPGDRSGSPFCPEQALELATALRAFTAGSAFVNHDDAGGSIDVGKRADFAVIDRNLFDPESGPIGDAEIAYTVLAGQVVYER